MVTTRLQEQLIHTVEDAAAATPPAASAAVAAEAHTPAAEPEGDPPSARKPMPLKSALKGRRDVYDGLPEAAGAPGNDGTPVGAHSKKQVRIASASNFEMHVYELASEEDEEEQPTGSAVRQGLFSNNTRSLPGYAAADSRRLLRYQNFLARSMSPDHQQEAGGDEGEDGSAGPGTSRLRACDSMRIHRRPGGGKGARTGSFSPAWALTSTLLWMLCSSALIFINARFMVDHGFHYPFALTAVGQISSSCLAWVAGRVGLARLGPAPPLGMVLTRLLPVACATAASLFLGNYAYLGLSVSFINVLKALTPLVTLCASMLAGTTAATPGTLAAVLLIGLGTAMATSAEAMSTHFSWLAFTSFLFSIVSESLRVVMVEHMLGGRRYNPIETLLYLGPPTFVLLALGSWAFEWKQGLSTQGLAVLLQRPGELVLAFITSFLVNLSCFWAIQATSSTSFKVAGCLKNIGVVSYGVLVWGDSLTRRELHGYALSLVGFFIYTLARGSGDKPAKGAAVQRAPSSGAAQRRAQLQARKDTFTLRKPKGQ